MQNVLKDKVCEKDKSIHVNIGIVCLLGDITGTVILYFEHYFHTHSDAHVQ